MARHELYSSMTLIGLLYMENQVQSLSHCCNFRIIYIYIYKKKKGTSIIFRFLLSGYTHCIYVTLAYNGISIELFMVS
jgi:hypothetical protein